MSSEGVKASTDVTDELLKSTIRQLWASEPETKALGTPKLRMLLRAKHTEWQIAEKRLRRVRQELFSEETPDEEHEHTTTRTPPEFEGFNKHKTYDAKSGRMATVFTAPGASGPQQMIAEDGEEFQVMSEWGVKIATGRKFRKDETTGEWVL